MSIDYRDMKPESQGNTAITIPETVATNQHSMNEYKNNHGEFETDISLWAWTVFKIVILQQHRETPLQQWDTRPRTTPIRNRKAYLVRHKG